MNSLSPEINALHASYCQAMTMNLPMNMAFERWWAAGLQMGLTPEHVRICVEERVRLNRQNPGYQMKLGLVNLIRDEEDVAVVINEAEVVLARRRIKVMEPGKARVLRQSGRSDQIQTSDAKVVGEMLENLRKSAL